MVLALITKMQNNQFDSKAVRFEATLILPKTKNFHAWPFGMVNCHMISDFLNFVPFLSFSFSFSFSCTDEFMFERLF